MCRCTGWLVRNSRRLPERRRAELERLWAVHDFQRSRDLIAPGLVDPAVQKMLPPVARPLVRVNPVNCWSLSTNF